MPPAGFEPAIPASERPQTHALDRVATGIGSRLQLLLLFTVKYTTTDCTSIYVLHVTGTRNY